MYTIIRFQSADGLEQLRVIGQAMNSLRPGMFTGMRQRNDGFVCEIAKGDDWHEHVDGMLEFLSQMLELITTAQGLGASVGFDVAIGEEDFRSRPYRSYGLDCNTMRRFASVGVTVEFTVYWGACQNPPSEGEV